MVTMSEPQLSHLIPIVDTRTNCVVAWRCRITMMQHDQTAFDVVEQPLEAQIMDERGPQLTVLAPIKAVSAWTEAEARELLAQASRVQVCAARLRQILDIRCYRRPIEDFTFAPRGD